MSDFGELERLREAYAELQLRVTRFSAVEQELINTRDRLDNELEMYKRLHFFNSAALKEQSGYDFIRLVAEAIIDVFELESSVVHLERSEKYGGSITYYEGMILEGANQEDLLSDIQQLSLFIPVGKSIILQRDAFHDIPIFSGFNEALCTTVSDPESEFKFHLIGLISQKNAPLYNKPKKSHPTIFSIFAQQVESLLANRQKRKQIDQQILKIQASDRELRKLSLIATKTKNGVIITDNQGRIEWVNDSFVETSGYTLEEIIGKKPKEFLQREGTSDEVRKQLSEALREKKNIEVTIINHNKSGKPYYNQLEITPVFDEKGNHINFIALQKDITSEMMFKQEILRVNSRLEKITTSSGIGVWEYRPDTNTGIWNDVMYSIYGAERTLKDAKLLEFWTNAIIEEDRERITSSANEMLKGSSDLIEHEYSIQRKDTQELRTIRSLLIAERDEKGQLLRIIGTSSDVTEVRNYERNIISKNEELKKINAELDNFVYSISHDLRSPLLSIKGILSIVKDATELSEKNKHFLDLATTSAERLDATIQEILDYSRNARLELQLTEFDLKQMVEVIFDDLKYACQDNMRFTVNLTGSSIIRSDKYRVNTLLKNIISNSVKYHRTDLENPFVTVNIVRSADKVTLDVIDNGQGIAEKNIEKVFGMFFRGTSKVPGTGLGLYICKEILAKLNGNINVKSKVDEGTTMTISFPI